MKPKSRFLRMVNWRRWGTDALLYLALLILVVVPTFPFFWMVSSSLRSPNEIMSATPTLLPQRITLENYIYVFKRTLVPKFLLNSLYIGFFVACFGTVVSALAGYAVSRFRFRGRTAFMSWLMYTKMFPWLLAMVPIYIIMARIRLVNNHLSLIIMYTVGVIPFATWMCKTYFDNVPQELEEAALVDGCTRVGALLRVTLPIAAPGMAAVWIYALVISLQEFMLALILLKDESLATLPLGIYRFIGVYGQVMWGPLMASAVLTTLPLVLAFLYLQSFIVRGLTAGAIKG